MRRLSPRLLPTYKVDSRTVTSATSLGNWLVLVDLNLDSALGSKLWDNDGVGDLSEYRWVGFAPEPIVEGVKIGSRDDVLEVHGLESSSWVIFKNTDTTRKRTSFELNTNGSGARLGPLQKGCPVLVSPSLGKLNRSCLISLPYFSSNCKRAQIIHSSNVRGLLVTR